MEIVAKILMDDKGDRFCTLLYTHTLIWSWPMLDLTSLIQSHILITNYDRMTPRSKLTNGIPAWVWTTWPRSWWTTRGTGSARYYTHTHSYGAGQCLIINLIWRVLKLFYVKNSYLIRLMIFFDDKCFLLEELDFMLSFWFISTD